MSLKTCIILGSSSDIGQALAYKFAQSGYNIILAARQIDDYQYRLSSDIKIRYNVEVTSIQFDGNKYDEHSGFWNALNVMPDIVISVFGYLGNQELAVNDIHECFNIISSNYIGHVSILNEFVKRVKGGSKASIIGISSVAGERGRQSNFIYGSAKAGFSTYLSGLRNELYKHGIHVMTVKPGFVNTKMIENLKTPKFLTSESKVVADRILHAFLSKKNIVYISPLWRYIMLVIKLIPESIFKKLSL